MFQVQMFALTGNRWYDVHQTDSWFEAFALLHYWSGQAPSGRARIVNRKLGTVEQEINNNA